MRSATNHQHRPGRWRAVALAVGLSLYAVVIVGASAICVAMSWQAGQS